MSDSTAGEPDAGVEGFTPPDRGFGYAAPPPVPQQQIGVAPPVQGLQDHTGPMYPGVYSGYYPPPMPAQQSSGMAVAGLTLGVLSLLLFWTPLGPVLAVPGIVFSSIGMAQTSKPGRSGMGMAIAGLVCSLVSAVIWVAFALLIAALLW